MTDEQINAAIAEACGWVDCKVVQKATLGVCTPVAYGRPSGYGYDVVCPSFATDLNAMHEAETVLEKEDLIPLYIELLMDLSSEPILATARQRAEAFLKTQRQAWEER